LPAAGVGADQGGADSESDDTQSDDESGANPYIAEGDDSEENNVDDASASDDSEEEILAPAQGASTSSARKWRRCLRLGLPPLSFTQVNNLEVRFDGYTDQRETVRCQPLVVHCAASFRPPGCKRVYGKITFIDGDSATLTVNKRQEHTLPLDRFKRRVPRLAEKTAIEWVNAEILLGGVPQLRAEYRHYARSLRWQRVVSEWHIAVLQGLRAAPDASGFNAERYTEVATSLGLHSKEGAKKVFIFLLQVSKAIQRKRGRSPTYKK
jgi:hypothetical protein